MINYVFLYPMLIKVTFVIRIKSARIILTIGLSQFITPALIFPHKIFNLRENGLKSDNVGKRKSLFNLWPQQYGPIIFNL